jgi:hypothetical protein
LTRDVIYVIFNTIDTIDRKITGHGTEALHPVNEDAPRSTTPRHPLILKLAVLSASIASALVIAELVVRLMPAGPHYRAETAYFDTMKMPPNSLGYYDYEYDREKGPGVFRIMVVGDSFSEGAGLSFDDIFPKRLERYLNCYGNEQKITYQVMNMSWRRRSTPLEVRLIKKYSGKYHPDLVILSYCLNDAEDLDVKEDLWRLRYIHPKLLFKRPIGWRGVLYDHSALAKLIFHRTFNTRNNHRYKRYYKELYMDDYQGWKKTQEALRELGNLSRSYRIPARVLIFPLFSHSLGDDYPFKRIHNKVHRALDKAGLPYIDLLPHYANMNHIRLEYIPDKDPHPDEIAHRIAAEALFQDLRQSGVLPGGKRSVDDVAFPRKSTHFVSD